MKKSICIHGHFYQPPRENPWTNEIELQLSAAPFHDWNERIMQECYKPNTEAIIINLQTGKVLERVNNFEYLNFNFGPTLLNWIKEKHPNTFVKIIEADKKSVEQHNGHGNAIAQVYNHIIMPLANIRDKITQIKWGLRDFEFNFSRKSEGIWLAETACNQATIELLIEEGIKYIILDPSQALKIKKYPKGEWEDVIDHNINTKFPYRCYSEKNTTKFINIFFYDGPLSRNIAFDDIIYSAERMMERFESIFSIDENKSQLVSVAVDGETFGHHKHFTERTIAYLLTKLAAIKNINVVNFGEYLELNPPEGEVKIKPGVKGEGTSWSCVHGVGRWKENCGCSTGGQPGWNQEWRKPLRESLNNLRDKLSLLFELEGKKYFNNVWDARNNYIEFLLDKSKESKINFLIENTIKKLNKKETDSCFKLLEMQKYAMFMFTSCGWFFSDISGIETVKILEYAKRAIEFAQELSGIDFETEFVEELSAAKSNIAEYQDGGEIFKQIGKG
jgi:alpha-amylase/alpha-mannosidase (GH57 family)